MHGVFPRSLKKIFHARKIWRIQTNEECRDQVGKIIKTLEAGKFPLTKWVANEASILDDVPEERKMGAFLDITKEEQTIKTLGLRYNPTTDEFSYKINTPLKPKFTKRGILSMAASIYDPIGWLLPVIMMLRIMIQRLWQQKLNWDEPVDEGTQMKFTKCLVTLQLLNQVRIPRWMGSVSGEVVELIGFVTHQVTAVQQSSTAEHAQQWGSKKPS